MLASAMRLMRRANSRWCVGFGARLVRIAGEDEDVHPCSIAQSPMSLNRRKVHDAGVDAVAGSIARSFHADMNIGGGELDGLHSDSANQRMANMNRRMTDLWVMGTVFLGHRPVTLSPCHPSRLRQPFDGDQMFDGAKLRIAGQQGGLGLL